MDQRHPKYIKLLEENIGENLCDIELDKDSLGMTPNAQFTKKRKEKLDFIKI